jgi:hypothetical protein
MVAKGNVDKHRQSYCGMKGVVETSKWGADKSRERYGTLRQPDMRPEDQSAPQKLGDANNLRGPGWKGDTPQNWLRGNGMSPNFDKGSRKK